MPATAWWNDMMEWLNGMVWWNYMTDGHNRTNWCPEGHNLQDAMTGSHRCFHITERCQSWRTPQWNNVTEWCDIMTWWNGVTGCCDRMTRRQDVTGWRDGKMWWNEIMEWCDRMTWWNDMTGTMYRSMWLTWRNDEMECLIGMMLLNDAIEQCTEGRCWHDGIMWRMTWWHGCTMYRMM